jgi:hypothetical protein
MWPQFGGVLIRGADIEARFCMSLLYLFPGLIIVGFAAGYCTRAILSRRHERIAKLYYPLPVPPFGRR